MILQADPRAIERVVAQRVTDHVLSVASVEDVRVVSRPALKQVVAGAADQNVVDGRTGLNTHSGTASGCIGERYRRRVGQVRFRADG